jgi:hypothetical protein
MKGILHKIKDAWVLLYKNKIIPLNPNKLQDADELLAASSDESADVPDPSKIELDQFYYHEVLDRLSVINDIVERHLIEHPVCDKHNEIKFLIVKAQEYIADAYLEMGSIINQRTP